LDDPLTDADPQGFSPPPTGHWSVVRAAGRRDSEQATAALEQLCRTYWYPIYAYARRSGLTPADAEDLTQEFFARLVAGDFLARADPAKGRFRSYLLAGLKHLLCDERKKAGRLKRGEGTISWCGRRSRAPWRTRRTSMKRSATCST
jgi:DNA-directed RNA polymerase specialized sigma24 family protein